MENLRILLIFAAFISTSYAFGPQFYRIKKILEEKRWNHNLNSVGVDGVTLENLSQEYPALYLEQPLDHFDPLVQSTYKQRYWVNSDVWNKDGGPVFLYIGGEGGLDSTAVQQGEHVDLAIQYKALVFAVEHRYYSESVNPDGLALENLQHLSSQQALGDLAHFHEFASRKYNLTKANTWISFGGSYAGALSAWLRVKYPHLVYGAVASSAPVRAVVNYEGYNDVAAQSFSNPLVNGSKLCATKLKEAFTQIDDMIANRLNEKLSRDFNSCTTPWEEEDVWTFVENLAFGLSVTVQGNNQLDLLPNITDVCKEITNASQTPYDSLRRLTSIYDEVMHKVLGRPEMRCRDDRWATRIKNLVNTTVAGGTEVQWRQWMYQTCSQFGYYQTCEVNSSCLYSRHLTLDMSLRICSEVFAIPAEEVYKRVAFTNAYYGSDQPGGTRIVFVNGSIDPWHALSVLKNISSSQTAIFIPGVSHVSNTVPARPDDPPALVQARKRIASQVGEWLQQARAEIDPDDSILRFRPEQQ